MGKQVRFVCPDCDRTFPKDTARVTVNGRTTCGDCAYLREINPEAPRLVRKLGPAKPTKDQLTLDQARAG